MKKVNIANGSTVVTAIGKNALYSVKFNGFEWKNDGRKPHIFVRQKFFGKTVWLPKSFASAKSISTVTRDNSIVTRYNDFRKLGKKLPFSLETTVSITKDGKVDFSVEAFNETNEDIKAVYFPAPFNAVKYDKTKSYSVDCMRQGFILPDTWKQNRKSIFLLTKYWRKANTGDSYLPLWGRVCGKKGFCGVLDDANDSTMFSCYGKNKAFLNSVNWVSSLGRLSYKRTVHFSFFDDCDYNDFAKEFRKQELEKGHLCTIDEKIGLNPNVAGLIGTPVYHTGIFSNTSPDSQFYKKGGENSVLHSTFENKGKTLERFKSLGLDRLYMHTDGWGERGYDNLCPYVLPPCPQAGGYTGMAALSEKCDELGYLFGIHDQYRDYYYDCKKFDMELAVVDENGKHPYCDIWAGGKHTWLCASQALDFVKTTYSELEEHDVKIRGTYLDVFSIMWGDECFNPNHKITRAQSIDYRRKCFDYLRNKGIIVSSEESGHLLVNSLDLVHHSPYAVRPQEGGVAVGIPVPMANLVYHDCVFVPWIVDGIGGWGIPDGDAGKLHCILNGQTPYLSEFDNDDEMKKSIENVKEVCNVEKQVYNAELISHKFLDGTYRRQQTAFSNGIKITVDFDKQTYKVEK